MYKLEWDSKFWDIDVYSIDKDYSFSSIQLDQIQSSNWIIQALLPEFEVGIINKLEENGFRFVQTKINFIKDDLYKVNINKTSFREINQGDIENYKEDFEILYGELSRFKLFNSDKIKEFYYLWVINSIKGKMDDKCVGYFINEDLAGFITYKIRNDEMAIGLVGVFPKFQRKGVGQELLNFANNVAVNENHKSMNISTQGINYHAINLYIKNGFIINNIQNWYYLRGR